MGSARKINILCLPVMVICLLLTSACENSLSDIKKIASKEDEKPISRSMGVEVIVSDSNKVKFRLTTPLIIEHDDKKNPYKDLPNGVKIVFYDDSLKEKGTITADHGVMKGDNLIEFYKNVVTKNAQGEIFKSEELIDDLTSKKLYSNKAVQIIMTNGDVMYGTGFKSNQSMYPWTIEHSTGIFHVDNKENPLNQ